MSPEGVHDRGRQLMLRVRDGDEEAFASLVEMYQSQVINTIHRYVGDASRAEDLAQEVFLRVFRARRSYQPLAKFGTWLYRIVQNLVINEAAARRRRRTVSLEGLTRDGESDIQFPDLDAEAPVEALERAELAQRVREAVLALPGRQRLALVLNKYQDQSYEDVAAAMEMSVEAVRSLLFRARDRVRRDLERYLRIEVRDEG